MDFPIEQTSAGVQGPEMPPPLAPGTSPAPVRPRGPAGDGGAAGALPWLLLGAAAIAAAGAIIWRGTRRFEAALTRPRQPGRPSLTARDSAAARR